VGLADGAGAAGGHSRVGEPEPGTPGAAAAVSAAKVACTEAAVLAARAALQVHGAIGYTEEHDLHLWLTKVRALAGAFGGQSEHRARVMAALTTTGT
jgi:alkylation response protein AidB-like acyl-CoA dehydrogenase